MSQEQFQQTEQQQQPVSVDNSQLNALKNKSLRERITAGVLAAGVAVGTFENVNIQPAEANPVINYFCRKPGIDVNFFCQTVKAGQNIYRGGNNILNNTEDNSKFVGQFPNRSIDWAANSCINVYNRFGYYPQYVYVNEQEYNDMNSTNYNCGIEGGGNVVVEKYNVCNDIYGPDARIQYRTTNPYNGQYQPGCWHTNTINAE